MNKPHFENKYLLPSILSRNECTTLLFIEVESPPTQDLLWGREGVAQLTNAARRALRRRGRRPCARAEALASEPAGANRGPEQAAVPPAAFQGPGRGIAKLRQSDRRGLCLVVVAPGAVPTLGFRETLLVEETAHRRGGGGAGGRAGRGAGLSAGVGAAVPAALSRMRKKVEGRAETGPEAFTAVIIENVNASRSLLHHARTRRPTPLRNKSRPLQTRCAAEGSRRGGASVRSSSLPAGPRRGRASPSRARPSRLPPPAPRPRSCFAPSLLSPFLTPPKRR